MEVVKEITVIVPNRVGELAGITQALGGAGINILALSAQGFGDKGVIRLVTSDEKGAMRALQKYIKAKKNEYGIKIGDALAVTLPDKPGELAKVCDKIARAGVNIESVYVLQRGRGITEVVITPEHVEEAMAVLKK